VVVLLEKVPAQGAAGQIKFEGLGLTGQGA
jgi:hypothetical protein